MVETKSLLAIYYIDIEDRKARMGLFSGSPAKQHLQQAKAAYHGHQYHDALRLLKDGFALDPTYKPLYQLAGDCLVKLGGAEEAKLFDRVLRDFKNADAFFDLGAHFNKVNYFDMALPFLDRALRLDARHMHAAMELSVAHASRFQVKEAIFSLNRVDYTQNFWTAFQMEYLNILVGKVKGTQDFIDGAREEFRKGEGEKFREPMSYLCMLEDILKRYKLLGKPTQDIRDWHFIQYGAAALDYYWDSEDFVAGGRYVALWGYPQTLRNIIEKLVRFLEGTDRKIKKVVGLNDHHSEITARAIAMIMKLPYEPYSDKIPNDHTLIVAGDNRSCNAVSGLDWVKENQVLFALNLNWLERQRYVPDVCGHLSQEYYFYWEGDGLTFDPETQEMKKTPKDERDPEQIAADIVELEPDLLPEDEALLEFYSKRRTHLKGGAETAGRRYGFTPESPVPGAYFH